MNSGKQHRFPKDNKNTVSVSKKMPDNSKRSLKPSSAKSKTTPPKLSKRTSISSQTGNNIEVILRCKGKHNLKSDLPSATRSSVITPELGYEETDVRLNEKNTIYKFDQVFYQECSQQKLYERVGKPIINEVLNGYNCTIFAYGQTGTGKTYTMEGDLDNIALSAGIIPRIIFDLFQRLKRKKDTVKISMLELYNEELRDLLRLNEESKPLHIFEDGTSGVKVQNVHEVMIADASQGLDIMKSGIKKRMTAATNCNEKSSRSHCIYTLTVTFQKEDVAGKLVFHTSKLNLVDLAGSENSKASGSEHLRAKEASSINKSLLTLGRVIKLLSEKAPHIPYRESKITRLLKDSLGGRTKTVIITTVDPLIQSVEEIKNTLEYSSHAKSISNAPQKNTSFLREKQMDELIDDILKMQDELHRQWTKDGHCMSNEEYDKWVSKLEVSQQQLVERNEENLTIRKELEKAEAKLKKYEEETKQKETTMQEELSRVKKELAQQKKETSSFKKDLCDISDIVAKSGVKREREDDKMEDRPRKK